MVALGLVIKWPAAPSDWRKNEETHLRSECHYEALLMTRTSYGIILILPKIVPIAEWPTFPAI
jgi:hypothetical protein